MITPEKIKEWMKEVEARPASAPLIIQHIANRLRDLDSRNQLLLAENIALRTGKRVEEYERQIAHLEYQLELLKRQFGDELPADGTITVANQPASLTALETISILIYNTQGRVQRVVVSPEALVDGRVLGRLHGELTPDGEPEPPRLLAVPSTEELLFVFTSGRVTSLPVTDIPFVEPDTQTSETFALDWEQTPVPNDPHAGETLACLVPISKIALAEFFIQASRRGCVKKIRTSMAQSILANHYIGRGVNQPADQTLDVILCKKDDRIVMISREGYLLCLETSMLSFSIEDSIRLGLTDHLVVAFVTSPGRSILVMTQIGKVIHRTDDGLKTANSLKRKGQPVFSQARREQGVCVVGAAAVSENDWGVALHQDGQLIIYSIRNLLGTGAIPVQGELLTFTAFPVSRTLGPNTG